MDKQDSFSDYTTFMHEHSEERLATLRSWYPQGIETANYFVYTDNDGIKWGFNKIYNTETPDNRTLAMELYGNNDDESYEISQDENQETDDDPEVYGRLKDVLTLDYKIENVDQFLQESNISTILNKSDNQFKNVIFFSPPNSGKTTAVINYLKGTNQKFIILLPTTLQVRQKSSDEKLLCLKGGDKISDKELLQSPFIVTTYEYFTLKLDKQIKDSRLDYYLVIDEFHKLISDSNYRGASLMHIYQEMFNYQRFIGLTGTPFGCINKKLLDKNVVIYKINVKHPKTNITGKYNIVKFKKRDRHGHSNFAVYYNYIKSGLSQGINVIFANNLRLLSKIRHKLVSDNIIQYNNSVRVSRRERDTPKVQKLIENSKLADDIKAIFTTSILSTGIDLEGNNFRNLFICGESNMIEVIQLIFRFRDGIENVYDFIPINNWYGGFFNFEKEVEKEFFQYKGIAENLNKFYRSRINILESLPNPHTLIKNSFIYNNNKQLQVNGNRIRWVVLSKIHEITFVEANRRKEYLELYSLGERVNILLDDYEHKVSIKGLTKETKAFRNELRDSTINCIDQEVSKTITYFSRKKQINTKLFTNVIIHKEICNLSNEDVEKFDQIFDASLTHPSVLQVIADFLFFYGLGISFSTSVNLTRLNDSCQVSKAIEFMRVLPLTKNIEPEAEQIYDPWIAGQIKLVGEMNKYLLQNKKIQSFKSLSEYIKLLKYSEEVTKSRELFEEFILHFQKKTQKQLSFIYNIRRSGDKQYYIIDNLKTVEQFFTSLKIKATDQDIENLRKYLNSANVEAWIPSLYKKQRKITRNPIDI